MRSRYPGVQAEKRGTPEERSRPLGDLGARVAVALPAAAVTVGVVLQGGLVLAIALALLGAAAVWELYGLLRVPPPARAPGVAAVVLLPLAALADGAEAMLLVAVASVAAAFVLARHAADGASRWIADILLGVLWVGVALSHGVLLRELPDGALLALGVLVGTFLGDTAAHLVGAAVGRHRLAPRLSPGKTLEGLAAGIVGGTAAVVVFMSIADGPLQGWSAVVLGVAVAVAAPVGDLFESAFKRDAGRKDSGRAFGAHGGVLDRVDAILFTVVAGYYVARLLL